MNLLLKSLPALQCPACHGKFLPPPEAEALTCRGCGAVYPVLDGIIDFLPGRQRAVGLAQRLLENPLFVRIYEDYWRPWFTRFFTSQDFTEEGGWLQRHSPAGQDLLALDLACGTGKYARYLADRYRSGMVFAADLSLPMLRKGVELSRARGLKNILFIRCDAHSLPFRDGALNHGNCYGAMHLFADMEAAIGELARVTVANGKMTAILLAAAGRRRLLQAVFSGLVRASLIRTQEIEKILEKAGFIRPDLHQDGLVLMIGATRNP